MISDASPMHMARDLVARHSDIGFIQGYVINYFGRAPTRDRIEALRAEYLEHQQKAANRAVQSDAARKARERRRAIERNAAKRYRERNAA